MEPAIKMAEEKLDYLRSDPYTIELYKAREDSEHEKANFYSSGRDDEKAEIARRCFNMYQPELVQVIPTKEYTVYLYYDDGNVRLYNAKPLIDKGGIFEKLKELDVFINTCTIMNDTLAWDVAGNYNEWECIDICPDTLLDAPIVENLEEVEERLFAHI